MSYNNCVLGPDRYWIKTFEYNRFENIELWFAVSLFLLMLYNTKNIFRPGSIWKHLGLPKVKQFPSYNRPPIILLSIAARFVSSCFAARKISILLLSNCSVFHISKCLFQWCPWWYWYRLTCLILKDLCWSLVNKSDWKLVYTVRKSSKILNLISFLIKSEDLLHIAMFTVPDWDSMCCVATQTRGQAFKHSTEIFKLSAEFNDFLWRRFDTIAVRIALRTFS